MSGIICAVRGGPGSITTIRRAIELARESSRPLFFLYVFNVDFLLRTSQSRLEAIVDNMSQMGEFILLMAQELALQGGVEAERVMRQGEVDEEIIAVCRDVDADVVILGKPQLEPVYNVFSPERLQELILEIEKGCRADVILVNGDEA